MPSKEPVSRLSADLVAEEVGKLKQLFPGVVTEGKIDFDKLRLTLGDAIVEGMQERFSFSWTGKREAVQVLQTPSAATLIPCPEESVNFETTQNLFIEGDNLEVLKLLFKPYFGKVKLIYIDPPYNTGQDFVYPDDYADPLRTYLQLTKQADSEGNLLTSNPETSGRYHSAWLSMMYPRLFLARQLLREDGVIFVSIDDHEVHHLRMLMNEVFGEENFVATLVWEKGRKNDATFFSSGHEYIHVYCRSVAHLRDVGTLWRESKPGSQELWNQYEMLRAKHGDDNSAIEHELQEWFKSLPKAHPAKTLSRFKHVDKWGPWRDRDISWPGGNGPRYDVIHPKTKKPCKVPERGWGFSSISTMQQQIKLGLVVFRVDESEPPFRKAHLRAVPNEVSNDEKDDENESLLGSQVMPSVFYKQSQVTVKAFRDLMDGKFFDNPKDHEVLMRLIRYCAASDTNDLVLDFFSGSSSTAQAVLELNREDGGNRRFILVQLPEPTGQKEFPTIAEIGKERIRRVIAKLQKSDEGKLPLPDDGPPEDLGFKVFKLASSNFRPWQTDTDPEPARFLTQLIEALDPLVEGWKPNNVIWEVAIKEGYGLNSTIEKLKEVKPVVYRVTDPDKGQSFLISLAEELKPELGKQLGLKEEDLFICRDSALNDSSAANWSLQCRLKTI